VFVTRCRQSFPAAAMERLEAQCQVSYWRDNSVIPKAELQAGLRGQHALLCLLTDKLDEEMLEGAGELKVVATMSVGHDHLDLAALHRRNIAVGYTPGVLTASTADLTVSLLLATSRRLMEGSAALRAGDWPAWSPQWLCGPELAGSTVGIVGLGNIGRAVMARLKPFGPSRFLYSGRCKKEEDWEDGAEFVSFEQLLQHSDFVLVTCAFSPELHHKFDKAAFATMKSSAVFINTSRGGIVNQEDLAEALSTNQIFAAGLDVMTPEPLPPSDPLTRLSNCVLVPHLGSATIQTRAIMANMTVENILAGLEGTKMPARVEL